MNFADLEAVTFSKLLGLVSDVTLVISPTGVVEDVSTGQDTMASLGCQGWLGKRWIDTVTTESKKKIEDLLAVQADNQNLLWRHVNHPMPSGGEAAIQYITVALKGNKFLAVGRNLERLAELQRRLVETQQSMERDFLRLRHIEARYRVLFETSPEAVLMVDAHSYRLIEANAGTQALFKDAGKRLVGRDFRECFDTASQGEIQSLLRTALATGRIEMCSATLLGSTLPLTVSATVFRQEGGAQFLVRLTKRESLVASHLTVDASLVLSEALEHFPDGWLLTDTSGSVKSVNEEGMALLGLTSTSQVVGQALEGWLIRGAVDWGVINTSLKQHKPVRNFATEVRTLSGMTLPVEISGVYLAKPEPLFVIFIRDINRRTQSSSTPSQTLPNPFADLSQFVGRRPIKDIVGDTVDTIERMCIEAALELTHNNRASAAEMLGLSRQSLYVKLRRFGISSESDLDIDAGT
ncbi:MAG: transcriptional regulator PpsR [Limnohabitans sp.]|jgi:transcriptional regulator PpsR